MFDFIAYPMANLILLLYNLLGQSTVAAIAVLTLLINLIILPLTLKQQKSTRKMQEFQPQLQKLQKKYANDREKLTQEQMKLYQEAGINPMAGCLPLLIQMPIWFGLIGAIRYCIPTTPLEVFQFAPHIYKWLPGVVGIVPLQSTFLGMDLGLPPSPAQWWSYSLPVLVFVTSWLQQKLLTPPSDPDDQSQAAVMNKQMQTMMPLMMMFFTLSYSTGLSIYFIISSVIRIIQYYFVQNRKDDDGKSQRPAQVKKQKL
ncbi:MAG: YidC/Oxa1 family membrane protein insertase [Chloroflexi bacterium]|nr:YidC/Oxa1 family membrane protein insertase [Chloroflexota bacterium]